MNLKPIKANMTEVNVGGYDILFSYKTPVAAHSIEHQETFKTEKKWSKTTSRHINQWLEGRKAEERPQEFFDDLLNEVK